MRIRLLATFLVLACLATTPAPAATLRFDFLGVIFEDPFDPENSLTLGLSFDLPQSPILVPTPTGGFGTAPVSVDLTLFGLPFGTSPNSAFDLPPSDPTEFSAFALFLAQDGLDPFTEFDLAVVAFFDTPLFTGDPSNPTFLPGSYEATESLIIGIGNFQRAELQITVIPEPSAFALVGAGLVIVMARRLRRS